MNDKVQRQQRALMLYNLVGFTIIFAVFGLIFYSQIRASLYQPVENTLETARTLIGGNSDWIERQLSFHPRQNGENWPQPRASAQKDEPRRDPFDNKSPQEMPLRVQSILRDESGEVLNPQVLGQLYFEGYLDTVPAAGKDELETITYFSVGGARYASLTFSKSDEDGTVYRVQLISNVEGEQAILQNFLRLLVVCILVFALLSLLASYLLSRRTMAPIIRSWNRQTEFVENASHELRTPLTIIQNKLEAMLTRPQATVMERAEEIGVALSETRRLSKLTADLMTLARADSSETLLEKAPFSLDDLIRTVSEPYGELAEMQGKTLSLDLGFGGTIEADQGRIHELMVILLDNALKYTREGDAVRISTAVREGRAMVEVADNGIGIPQESLRRVFDRFYRADKARSRQAGGSGLGLSIAKWIVDAHDGAISAHSGPDGGAIIRVRLRL